MYFPHTGSALAYAIAGEKSALYCIRPLISFTHLFSNDITYRKEKVLRPLIFQQSHHWLLEFLLTIVLHAPLTCLVHCKLPIQVSFSISWTILRQFD